MSVIHVCDFMLVTWMLLQMQAVGTLKPPLCYVTGDVPRVDGQLAVARAFGDKSLKVHLSAQPDIRSVEIDDRTDFLILASDGLWKVDTFAEAKTKYLCQWFEDSNLDIL